MTRPKLISGGKRAIHLGLGVLLGGILAGSFFLVGLALVLMALGQLTVYCALLRFS